MPFSLPVEFAPGHARHLSAICLGHACSGHLQGSDPNREVGDGAAKSDESIRRRDGSSPLKLEAKSREVSHSQRVVTKSRGTC